VPRPGCLLPCVVVMICVPNCHAAAQPRGTTPRFLYSIPKTSVRAISHLLTVNFGFGRLIANPSVLCCFLRSSSTEAPSLHRGYPASLVLRASPSPHATRPVSHELPVDLTIIVWGFPCCVWSPMPTCRRHYPGRSDGVYSLVSLHRQRPSL